MVTLIWVIFLLEKFEAMAILSDFDIVPGMYRCTITVQSTCHLVLMNRFIQTIKTNQAMQGHFHRRDHEMPVGTEALRTVQSGCQVVKLARTG